MAQDTGSAPPDKRWERALVTGASSGIGDAFARVLASEGTDLIVVARNEERLQALAEELVGAHDIDVEVLRADLSDATDLAAVEARVAAPDDPVDLLVNNAGYGINGPFGEIPVDDEEAEIRVNVVALTRLTHAAIGRMRGVEGGGVLNVSSVAAFQPGPSSANYGATKAYVLSLSQAVHEEQKSDGGVHVSCLCPGLTRTEFQDRGGYDVTSMPDFLWQDSETVARAGLDGVAANRPVVVPGVHNKALTATMRLVPMGIARRSAGLVTERLR